MPTPKRNVVVFGKDDFYSFERTIPATGRWREFTWRELLPIQPVTVVRRADDIAVNTLPPLYRELMRFRLTREGKGRFYGETKVTLFANEHTLATEDRVIWHGHSIYDDGAFNQILRDAIYG